MQVWAGTRIALGHCMKRMLSGGTAVLLAVGLAVTEGCGFNLMPHYQDPSCQHEQTRTYAACEGNVVVMKFHYTASSCGSDYTTRIDCSNPPSEGLQGSVCLLNQEGSPTCARPCTSTADCKPTQSYTYYCMTDVPTQISAGTCSGTYGERGPCTATEMCEPGLVCQPSTHTVLVQEADGGVSPHVEDNSTCEKP